MAVRVERTESIKISQHTILCCSAENMAYTVKAKGFWCCYYLRKCLGCGVAQWNRNKDNLLLNGDYVTALQ